MYEDYLAHHGIKGQKWGERRFQNPDGSLTPEGKKRYGEELSYSNRKKFNDKVWGSYRRDRSDIDGEIKRLMNEHPGDENAIIEMQRDAIRNLNESYTSSLNDKYDLIEKHNGVDIRGLEANDRLNEAKKRRAQEAADRYAKSQAYKEAMSRHLNDRRGQEAQSKGSSFVNKLLGLGRKVVDTAKKVGSTIKDYATGKKKIFSSKQTITIGGPIPKTGKTTSKKTTITLDKNGITKRTTTRRR